jgi:hypothetical protein
VFGLPDNSSGEILGKLGEVDKFHSFAHICFICMNDYDINWKNILHILKVSNQNFGPDAHSLQRVFEEGKLKYIYASPLHLDYLEKSWNLEKKVCLFFTKRRRKNPLNPPFVVKFP